VLKYSRIKKYFFMKNIRFIAVLALLFLLPFKGVFSQQVQRNYLWKEYQEKGGYSALTIDNWQKQKLQDIQSNLKLLPEKVKAKLLESADQQLKREWTVFKLTDYLEYKVNGNRTNFESIYFDRRRKLATLIVAECIDNKGKYLNEIANGLWLFLEESTWVLPAHLSLQKQGLGLADPEDIIIDLFAGDTSSLLSWTKLLLQDKLATVSPMLPRRINYELNRRIIEPFLTRNDFWWQGFISDTRRMNNWNIWINSNMLLTALLLDNTAERPKMIEKAIKSADKFVNWYPEDGACDEGPGYWSGAGGELIRFIDLLTEASNNKLSWGNNKLMDKIGTYIMKVHIADNWFLNFADAPAKMLPDPAKVYTAGKLFKNEQMKQFAAYAYKEANSAEVGFNNRDVNAFVTNLLIDQELRKTTPKPGLKAENWFPDTEILALRQNEGSQKGLYFGAKGGHNGESHNHNDVGSFVLYLNGNPVLIDPGAATYTKQTFSPARYTLWVYQSDWHNLPTINGVQQRQGINFAPKQVSYRPEKGSNIFSMDLATVYPPEAQVFSWVRSFSFNKKKGELNLNEKYTLKEHKAPVKLNFTLLQVPVKKKDGLLQLSASKNGGEMYLQYDPALFEVQITEKVLEDAKLASVWGKKIYHLALKAKSTDLTGSHAIKFYQK
jgi:hypothetical protein